MAAADTARLVAELTLDDKMTRSLLTASKSVDQFGSQWERVGRRIGTGANRAADNLKKIGLVAGGFVASQVFFGIQALKELETAQNQTAAVIKSTGAAAGVTAKQVRDLAEAQEALTTVDDQVIQSGENLLLTFTNIGADVFPQATDAMVNMAIAMAQGDVEAVDLKSTAIQLGKALNDPVKGLTALTRVGVTFTKQQKDQIKAMTEAGDIAGAQAIILNELEREFGEAGEAAGRGFGADMRRFDDAIQDAQKALATGLLPVIREVTTWLTKKLAEPATLNQIRSFGEDLAEAFRNILQAAERIPWATIGSALQIGATAAKTIMDAFLSAPSWLQTAIVTGWGLNKLTGGAITGIFGEIASGFIKGVLGINAGVVNVNAAVVNSTGGIPTPGDVPLKPASFGSQLAGWLKSAGKLFIITSVPLVAAEVAMVLKPVTDESVEAGRALTAAARGLDPDKIRRGTETPAGGLTEPDVRDAVEAGTTAALQKGIPLGDTRAEAAGIRMAVGEQTKALIALRATQSEFGDDLLAALGKLPQAKDRTDVQAQARAIADAITKGAGSTENTVRAIDQLKAAQKTAIENGDTALATELGRHIKAVEAKLPGRRWVDDQLAKLREIQADGKITADEAKQATAIQADLRANGFTHAASIVAAALTTTAAVKAAFPRIADRPDTTAAKIATIQPGDTGSELSQISRAAADAGLATVTAVDGTTAAVNASAVTIKEAQGDTKSETALVRRSVALVNDAIQKSETTTRTALGDTRSEVARVRMAAEGTKQAVNDSKARLAQIEAAQRATAAVASGTTQAIKDKDLSVDVRNNINVQSVFSIRGLASSARITGTLQKNIAV